MVRPLHRFTWYWYVVLVCPSVCCVARISVAGVLQLYLHCVCMMLAFLLYSAHVMLFIASILLEIWLHLLAFCLHYACMVIALCQLMLSFNESCLHWWYAARIMLAFCLFVICSSLVLCVYFKFCLHPACIMLAFCVQFGNILHAICLHSIALGLHFVCMLLVS